MVIFCSTGSNELAVAISSASCFFSLWHEIRKIEIRKMKVKFVFIIGYQGFQN
jgi:hypothetical protein